MPLWIELFLLLSCGGFIALVEVSGESRYGVVTIAAGRCRLPCPWSWLNFGGAARVVDRRGERQRTTRLAS